MDLRTHRNTLLLVRQIFDAKKSTNPCITTVPQKPACSAAAPVARRFPRTSPEAEGISSEYLYRFINDLRNDDTLDPHGIMILRNGSVITEGTFGAYDQNLWHITHSECKSITALAIGMLIEEGKLSLDDKIIKIFEKKLPMIALLTQKDLTVRHLLTMSSAVVFNEAGAVTETDWVRCFLESSLRSESGKRFEYNSMNSYMLAAIVHQVSGQGLMSYLRERLWEPLGIEDIYWETCPEGIEKGGWGLYIRPEDIAKIGQLVLQNGNWEGQQLVSASWIREAASFQITTPEHCGNYNYGYHFWVGRNQNVFLFNGMFGQNVLGFPGTGILIVSNAGNNELFQQSNFYKLIEQYFSGDYHPEDSLPGNPEAQGRLLELLDSLHRPLPAAPSPQNPMQFMGETYASTEELCGLLNGRTYIADEAKSSAVGLLPLLTQTVQNNYTKGLKELAFSFADGVFTVTIREADEKYQLPVGFDAAAKTDLSFHGEPYKVGVTGVFTTNEDGILVLKIRISFLEIANTRVIKIFFYGDTIVTKWLETPGKKYFTDGLAAIGSEIKLGFLLNTILGKADTDYIDFKINAVFEPEVTCRLLAKEQDERR